MTVGFPISVSAMSVGTGTKITGTSSPSSLAATPHANTLAGDLVVFLAYYNHVDVTYRPADLGDGWVFPEVGMTSGVGYGIFLGFCIAPRNGSSGYAGVLGDSRISNYTCITHTFRIALPFKFKIDQAGPSLGWVSGSGSGASMFYPDMLPPYTQCLDLVGFGYNNGGTTTTFGAASGFTEFIDTGQTSPTHGIGLEAKITHNTEYNIGNSVTLAVAKTNKAGCRACIPIVAQSGRRHKLGARRVA